ncbi:MAG: hypothetical protein JSU64_05240 [candidate division WOR-3 bacterium]|nr:MAG: hypothetical protein JSU64_05240 [candidate division WOR-3 bacterium]
MKPSIFTRHSPWIIILLLLFAGISKAEKNAGIAMLLCVFPGGGQFYTERYVPGVIIGAAEIAIGYYAFKYHRDEDYTRRNSMLWWGFFAFGFSLADAYVGAKMHGFDVESDLSGVRVGYKVRF